MRRLAKGFSLVENVFSALVLAVVILGMSTVISTYSVSQGKTKDRPFALNLAQQQLDEIMMKLVTQNAMVFDNAPTARGRSYFLKSENLTVSAYYFNNFPFNAEPDPVGDPNTTADDKEMTPIPWETDARLLDRRPVPTDIADKTYTSNIPPANRPYIQSTLFYRNRFYTGGGDLKGGGDPTGGFDLTSAKVEMGTESPPKYVVRMQLFGIPDASGSDPTLNLGDIVRSSERLKANQYPSDPRTPPTACPYLIGDSNISGTSTGPSLLGGATGRIYLKERSAEGPDDPSYFPHFTSKLLVTRVYRIEDFLDNGSFYIGTGNPDTEIASASIVMVGRAQRK